MACFVPATCLRCGGQAAMSAQSGDTGWLLLTKGQADKGASAKTEKVKETFYAHQPQFFSDISARTD